MSATLVRNNESDHSAFAKELILKYVRLPKRRRVRVDRLLAAWQASSDVDEKDEIIEAALEIIAPDLLGVVDPVGTPVDQDELNAAPPANVVAYRQKIGEAIKRRRLELHLTQEGLAEKAGIPQSHVSRLESGLHTPTGKTIKRIAEALETSPTQIDLLYQED